MSGRKSKLTSETVRKLEQAFQNDFTVCEACSCAGISRETYYSWIKENKEFSDKMTRAKTFLLTFAKKNIAQAVQNGGIAESKWLLERRQKEVYSKEGVKDKGSKTILYLGLPPSQFVKKTS